MSAAFPPKADVLYDSLYMGKAQSFPALAACWGGTHGKKHRLFSTQATKAVYNKEQKVWKGVPHVLQIYDIDAPNGRSWMEDPKLFSGKVKTSILQPNLIKRIIHPGAIHRVISMPQHPAVVATHTDHKYVFIWNTNWQQDRTIRGNSDPNTPELILKGHKTTASGALDFNHHDLLLASGGTDARVLVWKLGDYEKSFQSRQDRQHASLSRPSPKLRPSLVIKNKHTSTIGDLSFNQRSNYDLISCAADQLLMRFDLRKHSNKVMETNLGTPLKALSWCRFNEHQVLTGGENGKAMLLDLRKANDSGTADLVVREFVHEGPVSSCKFLVEVENMIVTSSKDGTVRIWNSVTGELLFRHVGHQHGYKKGEALCVDKKPGGAFLSIGVEAPESGNTIGQSGSLQIWVPSSDVFDL